MILNRQYCKRKFSISFKIKCVNEIENSSIRTISKRYEISRNVLRKLTRNRGQYAKVKKHFWRNNISTARQAHFPELEGFCILIYKTPEVMGQRLASIILE